MTDSADPAVSGPSRPRAFVESALATAIDRYGPALFFDPDRLRQLLTEATTEAPKEIDLLLDALSETVPQTLLAAHGNEIESLLPRLVKQVMKHANVERGPATWAVRTWAHALALPTATIDSPARTMAAHPAAVNGGVDFASVITPRNQAPVIARTSLDRAAPPSPEPVASPPDPVEVAAPMRAPPPPIARPAPVPSFAAAPVANPPPASRIAPAPTSEGPPIDRIEALSDFVPLDEVVTAPAPIATPAFVEPPTPAPPTPEPVVDASEAPPVPAMPTPASPVEAEASAVKAADPAPIEVPIVPSAIEMPREASPPVPPEWAVTEPTEPRLPDWLSRPRHLAVVVLVLVVLGTGGIYLMSRFNAEMPAATTSADDAAPAVGQPRPVADEPKVAAPEPAASVATPGGEPDTGASTAGTPSASPALPAALDSHAAPAAPATTPGPTITRIDPQAAVAGKGFSIAVAIDGDPARVAAIERRVIASDTTWPTDVTTSTASALARTRSGAFILPFRPVAAASTSTLQFTAVDRKGVRGPSRSMTLRVANPVTTPATVERATATAGAAAPVAKKAERTACTKSNCGTVVSMRELEPGSRTTNYEIIVRMDDRKIHAVVQPNRWKPGTRLRLSGKRYVEIGG